MFGYDSPAGYLACVCALKAYTVIKKKRFWITILIVSDPTRGENFSKSHLIIREKRLIIYFRMLRFMVPGLVLMPYSPN